MTSKFKKLTYPVWKGLRSATAVALAGDIGGDFTEEDMIRIEKAKEWLDYEGEKRGYFRRSTEGS